MSHWCKPLWYTSDSNHWAEEPWKKSDNGMSRQIITQQQQFWTLLQLFSVAYGICLNVFWMWCMSKRVKQGPQKLVHVIIMPPFISNSLKVWAPALLHEQGWSVSREFAAFSMLGNSGPWDPSSPLHTWSCIWSKCLTTKCSVSCPYKCGHCI